MFVGKGILYKVLKLLRGWRKSEKISDEQQLELAPVEA